MTSTAAVRKAIKRLDGATRSRVVHRGPPGDDRRGSQGLAAHHRRGATVRTSSRATSRRSSSTLATYSCSHDDEIATVTADGGQRHRAWMAKARARAAMQVEWDLDAAEKGGYEDFMLKEIHEQPKAHPRDTLAVGCPARDGSSSRSSTWTRSRSPAIGRVFIIACGTSLPCGARRQASHRAVGAHPGRGRRVERVPLPGSDRGRRDARRGDHAVGRDGRHACRRARGTRARREGHRDHQRGRIAASRASPTAVIYTHAGPEIGVAATKTFTAQIAALNVLALKLAQAKGTLSQDEIEPGVGGARSDLPDDRRGDPRRRHEIHRRVRRAVHGLYSSLFLGRGIGVPMAMEGALKLKEISYIHAEAYPAGEMKHGPIALITEDVPVVVDRHARAHLREGREQHPGGARARGARSSPWPPLAIDDITTHAEHVLARAADERGAVGDTGQHPSAAPRVLHREASEAATWTSRGTSPSP